MGNISNQAEQAREGARESDGRFGSHQSAESGASLTGAGHHTSHGTGPDLSDDQIQRIDDEHERIRQDHDNAADWAFGRMCPYLDENNDRPRGDLGETEAEDYVQAARQYNRCLAQQLAFEAPTEATVAEIEHGGAELNFYDRNGRSVEGRGGIYSFQVDPDHGIEVLDDSDGDFQYSDPWTETQRSDGFEYLDLEAVRTASDSEAHELHRQGQTAEPLARSNEVRGLQRQANLRHFHPDSDTAYPGDEIEVRRDDTMVHAGIASNRVPRDFDRDSALRITHAPDQETGRDFTDLTYDELERDGVSVYTDRQREIGPESEARR